MSITYLNDRSIYEKRYDKITVELCRVCEQIVYNAFGDRPALDRHGHADSATGYYQYSIFYFQLVELLAGERWQERDTTISKWMKADEEKDRRLAEAKPSTTPYCRSCGEDMRIKLKSYASRERGDSKKDDDDILLMFKCEPCNKLMALWQDGTEWEGYQARCEKCNAPVDETDTVKGNVITSTYTCPNCDYDYKNVWKLGAKPKTPADPHFKVDRRRFCFDAATGKKFLVRKAHIEHLGELLERGRQRAGASEEAIDPLAGAVEQVKKLKVAQVVGLLSTAIAKVGYTKFKLGEPQIGREVAVPFTCLDNQPERESYDSRMGLKKLITATLADTNWQLMSDGVHYRLGYLSGRVRAYESDEDLRKLIERQIKAGTRKPAAATPALTPEPPTPVEPPPTPKRSRRGKQRAVRVRGVLHQDLHMLIPPRETKGSKSKTRSKQKNN